MQVEARSRSVGLEVSCPSTAFPLVSTLAPGASAGVWRANTTYSTSGRSAQDDDYEDL
jgi:hypothetical protein